MSKLSPEAYQKLLELWKDEPDFDEDIFYISIHALARLVDHMKASQALT
jgi:hypothetical protein